MDVERTIEFLLQQQARFAEQQARFAEQQARFAEQQARFGERQAFFVEMQARHEARQEQFAADIAEINGLQQQSNRMLLDVATAQERTNEIVAVLAQKLVDLSALVERHIANHN
ncbi:MAG TPA: hypothetical protein VJX67_17110 [Blastocatellia bacterium]|nr:hypothetical protein [Blastocatellia bacterium]